MGTVHVHIHPPPSVRRWFGVTCCATSPLTQVDCDGAHSVALLSLDSFGLAGTLPPQLGDLPQLTALALANNLNLTGTVPQQLAGLPHLLWMSVEVRGANHRLPRFGAGNCTGQLPLLIAVIKGAVEGPYWSVLHVAIF